MPTGQCSRDGRTLAQHAAKRYSRGVTTLPELVPDSERRGLIGALPAALRPYAALMRIDRPIGTWLLFWPCAWSVALAGVGGRGACSLLFALGAFVMRSAGCAYNDIVDRDLDRQVERTRLRPLASGRVGVRAAWALVVGAVAGRARRAADAAAHRATRRAGQPRAGRGLSLHEAHHLVAAGVARAGVLVGRAGRLAGGDRRARAARVAAVARAASSG